GGWTSGSHASCTRRLARGARRDVLLLGGGRAPERRRGACLEEEAPRRPHLPGTRAVTHLRLGTRRDRRKRVAAYMGDRFCRTSWRAQRAGGGDRSCLPLVAHSSA